MSHKTKTRARKAAAVNSLPMLSDEQTAALLERTGDYGVRCFLGIHQKVVCLWPTGNGPKVSRRVACYRCGETLERHLLSSNGAPAADQGHPADMPSASIARTVRDLDAAPMGYIAVDRDLLVYTKPFHSSNGWLLGGFTEKFASSTIALPARLYRLSPAMAGEAQPGGDSA